MGKSTERRDENFDKAFSKRLTNALPDRQILACAAKTGVNQATLHRWRIEPPRAFVDMKRIAEFCGTTPSELCFGERVITKAEADVLGAIERLTTHAGQPVEPPDDSLQQSPRQQLSRKECVEGLRVLHQLQKTHKAEKPLHAALQPLIEFLTEEAASHKQSEQSGPLPASKADTSDKGQQAVAVEKSQASHQKE